MVITKKMTIMMRKKHKGLENRKNDTIFPKDDPAFMILMTRMTVLLKFECYQLLDFAMHWL